MAAKDLIHNAVKQALIKDGWTVTDDPYTLAYAEDVTVFVDLGAERLIAAQRDLDKIAVEIKPLVGHLPSMIWKSCWDNISPIVHFWKRSSQSVAFM